MYLKILICILCRKLFRSGTLFTVTLISKQGLIYILCSCMTKWRVLILFFPVTISVLVQIYRRISILWSMNENNLLAIFLSLEMTSLPMKWRLQLFTLGNYVLVAIVLNVLSGYFHFVQAWVHCTCVLESLIDLWVYMNLEIDCRLPVIHHNIVVPVLLLQTLTYWLVLFSVHISEKAICVERERFFCICGYYKIYYMWQWQFYVQWYCQIDNSDKTISMVMWNRF